MVSSLNPGPFFGPQYSTAPVEKGPRQGLHPLTLYLLERRKPSVFSGIRQDSFTESPHEPAPARTALQKAHMRLASTASQKAQSRKGQTYEMPGRFSELSPKILELRVVLRWAVCCAQARAAWVCTRQHTLNPEALSLNPRILI